MKAKPRKKVTLRASKITSLYVPRSLVENPPNFSQPEKKEPFKIRIPIKFLIIGLCVFLWILFIFLRQSQTSSNIPDYMTTTNEYKPITPQEPVKVETTGLFVCSDTSSSSNIMCNTLYKFFSLCFGVLLFLLISIIVLSLLNGILKSLR